MSHKVDTMKNVVDVCAHGVTAACVMEWLTPVAAIFSIAWVIIRIFDYVYKKQWRDKEGPK